MMIRDRDTTLVATWDEVRKKDGRKHAVRGVIVGWVSRGKRVCAIVVLRRRFVAVLLEELKLVRSRK